ncbi:MAG: GNAT family N-acetyltransferase [Oscillospiraceae bacterium]|nr:GNAT family N-acetyltransferase [Oscillospiraceae bacterium]
MNKPTYISISEKERPIFHKLMQKYARELDEHQHRTTDPEILARWTDSIIDRQSDEGRYLRLCCIGSETVGFLYGKTDLPDDKGYKRTGWGYIMEFYVLPDFRRRGIGTAMLGQLEDLFRQGGVTQLYLTADPVTGKPFWSSMGYTATGEISPDNGQEIYEKIIFHENTERLHAKKATAEDASHISSLYNENISALHSSDISTEEWRKALSDNDPDELHILIYSGCTPAAWLKINGLAAGDDAWISMLAVSPHFQKQGIGRYAVRYAEQHCKALGKRTLLVKTTEDNTAAQKLYLNCGFSLHHSTTYLTSDGTERKGIVYSKHIG